MDQARVLLHEIKPEEAPEPARNNFPLKKILIFAMLIMAVGLAFVLSYSWFIYSASHISTDNAFIDSNLYPVSGRIMGYVKEVVVSENQEVKKGQLLAVLDDTDFGVELTFKKAKLAKAVADMGRANQLLKSRAISHSDFELAEANLIANQADYDGTMLKLKYTKVLAPANGIIGKKTVEIGQFIQPGQALFVIVANDSFWIKANYKETQLSKIKIGQKVEIFIDAFPKVKFYGHVDSIYPSSGSKLSLLPPENATGNFTKIVQRVPIKIVFDGKQKSQVRSGMSASPTIIVED